MTSDSKWIWFDMDGTLSDLYAVHGWKEKVRAFDPAPYREAKPLLRFDAFARQVNALKRKEYQVGVISWSSRVSTPEYHEAVAAAKHAWLRRHLPSVSWDSVLVVPFGTPKWQVCAPGMLFDDDELARVGATFGYDAIRDGAYVLSFLDSDIFRLHAFWDTVRVQKYKASVICFPEQVPFLRSYLRGKVNLQTVTMDMVENAIMEGCDFHE